jgi:hypothetical protein
MADITRREHLNKRRHRGYPRFVKRARHNSYQSETRRPRHPPRRTAHNTARQPRPDQHRGMIKNKLSALGRGPRKRNFHLADLRVTSKAHVGHLLRNCLPQHCIQSSPRVELAKREFRPGSGRCVSFLAGRCWIRSGRATRLPWRFGQWSIPVQQVDGLGPVVKNDHEHVRDELSDPHGTLQLCRENMLSIRISMVQPSWPQPRG